MRDSGLISVPFLADLVQGLNSADPAVKEKAVAETERRLHDQETSKQGGSRAAVDRTVINTRASGEVLLPLRLQLCAVLSLLNSIHIPHP